jgi:hypothetical protein
VIQASSGSGFYFITKSFPLTILLRAALSAFGATIIPTASAGDQLLSTASLEPFWTGPGISVVSACNMTGANGSTLPASPLATA